VRIGYVRTSKKDQNPGLQRRELEAAGCERVFEESISSRKEDRPSSGRRWTTAERATLW
jgi:DNA invertase Pin-like site-specific DNA recombinase